jgi:group I intron endonuclease
MKLETTFTTKSSGVYSITNQVTGQIYYGSSVDLERRYKAHRYLLCLGKHPNQKLQRSWDKYGSEQFVFGVVRMVEKERLIECEQDHIDLFFGEDSSFNLSPTAGSTMGYRHSLETKKKMSIASKAQLRDEERYQKVSAALMGQKGHPQSQETREKIRISLTDREFSKEHREAISEAKLGHVVSEETKEKLRQQNTGANNPNFGLKRSEETKAKMRESWIRRKQKQNNE